MRGSQVYCNTPGVANGSGTQVGWLKSLVQGSLIWCLVGGVTSGYGKSEEGWVMALVVQVRRILTQNASASLMEDIKI